MDLLSSILSLRSTLFLLDQGLWLRQERGSMSFQREDCLVPLLSGECLSTAAESYSLYFEAYTWSALYISFVWNFSDYFYDQEDYSWMLSQQRAQFLTFLKTFFIEVADLNLQLYGESLDFLRVFSSLGGSLSPTMNRLQLRNRLRWPILTFRSSRSSFSVRVSRSLPLILFWQKASLQSLSSMASRKASTSLMVHSLRALPMHSNLANLQRPQYLRRKMTSKSRMLGLFCSKMARSSVLKRSLSRARVGNCTSSSLLLLIITSLSSLSCPYQQVWLNCLLVSLLQYCPLPCFTPALNSPMQQQELAQVNLPVPEGRSSCHSPSYCTFSYWYICRPRPSFLPFTHSPRQKSPFAYSIDPFPWGAPRSYSPSQRSFLTTRLSSPKLEESLLSMGSGLAKKGVAFQGVQVSLAFGFIQRRLGWEGGVSLIQHKWNSQLMASIVQIRIYYKIKLGKRNYSVNFIPSQKMYNQSMFLKEMYRFFGLQQIFFKN